MLKQTERKKVSYFSKKKKNHFINVKSYINIKLLEGKQKPGFITFCQFQFFSRQISLMGSSYFNQ